MAVTTATRKPTHVQVTFRSMKFDFDSGFRADWHGGSPFISHFWSALSQALPPGEKFFIDSLRAIRERVDDPELLDEIEQFVRQEAHHTAQHRKFNRMVQALGYDTEALEARYARALDLSWRLLGPLGRVSVTMALEHFTAGLAHQYFTNPRTGEGADPKVLALWAWHAAEEAEHKSTAFDAYRRAGGGYWWRLLTAPSWFIVLGITLLNVADMLRADGKADLRDVARGARYLFGTQGVIRGMLPGFGAYLGPSFHPWDEDDSDELKRWESESSRYIVQRRSLKRERSPRRTAPQQHP